MDDSKMKELKEYKLQNVSLCIYVYDQVCKTNLISTFVFQEILMHVLYFSGGIRQSPQICYINSVVI